MRPCPVLLILIAISVRGSHLPTRETLDRGPAPRRARSPMAGCIDPRCFASAAIVALFTLGPQWRLAIVVSTIAALIGLSCVVVTGYVGQISLAQYAFAGLAAFTTAKLAVNGVGFPWAPLLAVALTVVVGILVGLPAVRVRGMSLAVATIAAAVAIEAARLHLAVAQRRQRRTPAAASSASISASSPTGRRTSAPRSVWSR